MKLQHSRFLAWSTWMLTVVFTACGLALSHLNGSFRWNDLLSTLALLGLGFVGALIAGRIRTNPIGWLFCAGPFLWAVGACAKAYAVFAFGLGAGQLPGGAWMGLLGVWIGDIAWLLHVTFMPLLFPTGGLPSRRWRPIAWLVAVVMVVHTVVVFFVPGPLQDLPTINNPAGLPFAGGLARIRGVLNVVLAITVAASVASPGFRFRSSRGVERQQLKWVSFVAGFMLATYSVMTINQSTLDNPAVRFGAAVVSSVLFVLFPVSVGIAILKHRLYDIDVLINRALVYGLLTLSLALVYLGSVVLLQQLVRIVSGEMQSELVTVVSTLAIAALFQPLRRRIQALIDRRFYRRKYDAARTLTAFAARLRDETDLEELSSEMLHVVEETLQPAHLSLWLRKSTG